VRKLRKNLTVLGFLVISLTVQNLASAVTVTTYTSGSVYAVNTFTGNETWTMPYGVSSISVLAVGGGGGGGADGGNGGAGGEKIEVPSMTPTVGTSISIVIGNGGASATAGGATTVTWSATTQVQANGGGGGLGWTQNAGNVGGTGGSATSTFTSTQGKIGGVGPGYAYGCVNGPNIGTAGTEGTTSTINNSAVVYGSGGGGGIEANATGLTATLGALGGTGAGQGANYGKDLDNTTNRVGVTAGHAAAPNQGGGGGGGGACNSNGYSGSDQYTRTAGGVGGSGVVVFRFVYAAPSTPNMTTATDSGYSNSDDRTNVTTPVFTGTAIGGSTIQLKSDGVTTGSTCAADVTTGAWSCTAGTLSDGSHTITAVATLGAATSTSSGLSVVIDSAVPTLSSTVSNSTGTQLTLSYNETLNTYSIPVDSFTVTVLGLKDTVTAASASSTTLVITLTFAIPIGASPTISYTNPVGNQSDSIQDLAGNEAATLSSQAITNNATATASTSVSFSVTGTTSKLASVTLTATVASSISPNGTVTFFENGKSITRCVNKAVSGGVATCSWKILIQGQRAISARFNPTYPNSVDGSSTTKYLVVGKRTGSR
jgi:hypothetical protein